jgi:hypothetical protein
MVKFVIPKFMKIRCYIRIIVTFGSGFQIKLIIYGSSLSLRCVSMSELELVYSMFKTSTLWNLQIFLKRI